MSGRILLIETVATRRTLLRRALKAAFLQVEEWREGTGFWPQVQLQAPDVVICGETVAYDVLSTLGAAGPSATDIPLLVIAQDSNRYLVQDLLQAGARDVAGRGDDPDLLIARVRRLLRQRAGLLDLRKRCGDGTPFALQEGAAPFTRAAALTVVSPSPAQARSWATRMASGFDGSVKAVSPAELFFSGRKQALVLPGTETGLALLADVLAHPETRDTAVLVVTPPGQDALANRALNMGAGDVLTGGFDGPEAILRLRHLLRLKSTRDGLKAALADSVQAALSDPLTGLHNRRYALPKLEALVERASTSHQDLAVMLIDIDHFKSVNDTHGHAAGDAILKALAARLRGNLRQVDLLARIGGEEFLVAMPDTSPKMARHAAERLRLVATNQAFVVDDTGKHVRISISVGVTFCAPTRAPTQAHQTSGHEKQSSRVARLLESADRALYRSKGSGRNRVTLSKSAA